MSAFSLPETHVVIITPLHFLQDNAVSEEASTCPRFREGEAISSHRQDMNTSGGRAFVWPKLQALLYDFLPSDTAVLSYAIGSRKLSANEQFFVGAQTVVS